MNYEKDDYIFLSNLLYNGIIKYDLKKINDCLSSIQSECFILCDDITELIFKSFIVHGNVNDTVKSMDRIKGSKTYDFIIDTIVFKQSNSQDISILAKLIYRKFGQKYRGFLDWQLEKLFAGQEIDILEEFAAYRISIGREPYTPDILK